MIGLSRQGSGPRPRRGPPILATVDSARQRRALSGGYRVQRLEACGFAERIVFEITESEDIVDDEKIVSFIREVRRTGAKFAIDDFGSGYSNFAYIMKMEPDYIKIDGTLIKDIHTNDVNRTLVKTIVAFSKELQIKTIAEYVHSKEVHEVVQEFGVDEYQGFYIQEPTENILQ